MEINKILSLARHCLHLCNNSNIEETVFYYLADADAFVTNNSKAWIKKFRENEVKCKIIKPNDVNESEKIVVDGSSLGNDFIKWEEKWLAQASAVCVYNIDEIEHSILKHLVDAHDKMLLSIDNVKVISDKNLENELDNLSPDIVENLVKRELKNIVLSLIISKPMSGIDIVKLLYEKFKVFISPGMLYPTLHELEKKGLLKFEYKLKNKVYSVQEKGQAIILLKNHVRVNSLLSQLLLNE